MDEKEKLQAYIEALALSKDLPIVRELLAPSKYMTDGDTQPCLAVVNS